MWRNYLTTGWRALWKSKVSAVINVAGLGIGLAGALMIFLLVRYELGYERWMPGAESVYQIIGASRNPSGEWFYAPASYLSQASLKPLLEQEVPEFQEVTQLYTARRVVGNGQDAFFEDVAEVDPNFFTVLELPFAQGSAALSDLSTILISESIGKKYFGDADPIGRTLVLDKDRIVRVGGVFDDLPRNTHLDLHLITRFDATALPAQPSGLPAVTLYARAAPGTRMTFFENRQAAIVESYFGHLARPGQRISDSTRLIAMLLPDLHLYAKSRDSIPAPITWLYAFSATAALLLVVAGANFVNLSTARALIRAREISLRQALGARRRDVIAQLLAETLSIMALASGAALLLVELARPGLAAYLRQPALSAASLADPLTLAVAAALVAAMTLGAGLYPALYLSRIHPARRLHTALSGRPALSRSVLVALQYAIALGLALATWIFSAQIRHINTLDLGFERENLLAIEDVTLHQDDRFAERLAREMARLPGVEAVTMTGGLNGLPFDRLRELRQVQIPGRETESTALDIQRIDFAFFETLHAPLLAGRPLSDAVATDTLRVPAGAGEDPSTTGAGADPSTASAGADSSTASAGSSVSAAAIINQAALRPLGFSSPQEAIGRHLAMTVQPGVKAELTVAGVADDIQWHHARAQVFPTIYYREERALGNMLVRVAPNEAARAREEIDRLWARLSPDVPLRAVWLEDRYNQLYEAEARQLRLFSVFTFLVLVTAAIGLYGLAALAAETRAREIGIRKVMGARSRDILGSLIWQFTRPVIAASVIAVPAVLYFMQDWLSGFVQRVALTPLSFLIAAAGVLLVALLAVATQVLRAARTYPAEVLRDAG